MNAYVAPGILENKKLTEAEVIDLIISEACEHFKVDPLDVFAANKGRDMSTVRHIIRYLLFKHTKLTLKRIGEVAHSGGSVAHQTVTHSIVTIQGFIDINSDIAEDVKLLDAVVRIKKT